MSLAPLFHRLYAYGADQVPPAERKRVQIGNLLSLAGFSITAGYGLVYLFVFGSVAAFAVNTVSAFGYLANFEWLRRGRPLAARGTMCVVFLANVFALVVLFFSTRSGVHLYYVLVGPIAFFLFDTRHSSWRYGLTIASIILFLLCELLPPVGLVDDLPDAAYRAMTITTVPIVMFVLLLIQNAFLQEIATREAALDRAARTDALTGVPNRRAAYEQAQSMFHQARRHGHRFAVMMIDVDHFKGVNDTHGHATGDRVLAQVAEALRSMLRTEDVLGRFGGEEFIVALAHGLEGTELQVAEKLRRRVAALRVPHAGGGEVACTVSVGVARIDAADTSLDTLLARADRALYRAKHAGRNRCMLAPAGANMDSDAEETASG